MTNPFTPLGDYKYCRLVTFRRNGTPVPTPMWFAVDGDRIVLKTEHPSAKLRRIRNDPRVEVAPCTLAGRPLGAAVPGRARLLAAGETRAAERALRRRYGVGRRLFGLLVEPIFALRGRTPAYIEVVSARVPS